MDADDIMHPQRLEKQYQVLLENDENTVVGTSAYSIDDNSSVIGFKPSQQIQKLGYEARYSFIHPTVAASTAWFCKNPYSDALIYKRSQDAELWCRTTSTTKFLNLFEPLLYYRENINFSLNNYLGTYLAALHLIHNNYSKPSYKYIYLFSRELMKIWLAFMLDAFNGANYLVSRRYKALNLQEIQAANKALAIVKQQNLA